MQDPREKRFFELQKRNASQLTPEEVQEYVAYCSVMIEFVGDKKSRRGWVKRKAELTGLLPLEGTRS